MRFSRLYMVIFVWISIAVSADCHAQQPDRPMTRKELRQERKRLKNAPLTLPELSRDGYRVTAGQRIRVDSMSAHVADSTSMKHDSLAAVAAMDLMANVAGTETAVEAGNAVTVTPMDSAPQGVDSLMLRSSVSSNYTAGDSLSHHSMTELIPPIKGYIEEEETYTQSLRDSTLRITDSVGGVERMQFSGTVQQPDSAARERRQLRRQQMRADTTLYRHSPVFRDTIPISRMTLISFAVPGFGQFYNGDYWKIPALYAAVGTSIYFGIGQHKQYVRYRDEYNHYLVRDPDRRKYVEEMDAAQTRMIQHNTWRQMLFGAAIGSYLYFIGDGVMNYPSRSASIKMATTLSTIFPGAGQFYNRSYWRATIFVGGIASMIYVIDWNDRIYQRYKTAYAAITDDDPITTPPRGLPSDPNSLKNTRDSARRNRDLCIILTGLVYFLNIMDAHVDAHLKDYDVSDDLAYRFRLEPSLNFINTQTQGTTSAFGLNLSYTF